MDTLGKSNVELVVKVYDGAIVNIRNAIDHYKESKNSQGYEFLEKAKKFIVHLYTTLDEDKGGEIAKYLGELYAFLIEQINFAQSTGDCSKLNDSIIVLGNIREAWVELAEKAKEDKSFYDKNPHDKKTGESIKISI